MIPPVTPGQTDEKQKMVGWKNTFNMRQISLMNLEVSQLGMKNGSRSSIPNLRQSYSITSPSKSLEILRKNLQNAINKDIDNILKKYIEKFFHPAMVIIKSNIGKDSVGEDHIREVCRQMLESAKSMYKVTPLSRDSSPYDHSQTEAESDTSTSDFWLGRASPVISAIKRKESDSDMDPTNSSMSVLPAKRYRQKSTHSADYSSCKLSLKRDGPKWDPDRIKGDTLFIMGARANKVLGYGQTRGRLYVRHPNLVRYSGDQEDKEWLASKNLMPPSGGKAYLMLLEDIKELTESEEYKHSPNLQLHDLRGFEVPLFLLLKIKNFIEYVRTERKLLAYVDDDEESNSSTPPSLATMHSEPSAPVNTNFLCMSSDMSVSLTSSVISNILASGLPGMSNNASSQDI